MTVLFDEPLVLLSEDGFNLVNRTTRVAFKVEGKIWVNNHAHVLRPHSGFNILTLVKDIVEHYQNKVEPNGFKAQVVTFDRESCHLFKQEFDKLLPPEASAVVMTVSSGESEYKRLYERSKDDEERLLDNFRDPVHPLQFLIVTSKLLTGFDAPILQVMYLDKPMKDHTLLQAICRTNRPFPGKSHGLIVDYLGVFDDVGRALMFDEKCWSTGHPQRCRTACRGSTFQCPA